MLMPGWLVALAKAPSGLLPMLRKAVSFWTLPPAAVKALRRPSAL